MLFRSRDIEEEQRRESDAHTQIIPARNYLQMHYQVVSRPLDKEDNYVKRCVALPGDKLEIIDQKLYINGQASFVSENMQYNYRVKTKGGFNRRLAATKFDVTERIIPLNPDSTEYLVTLPFSNVQKLKDADDNIISISSTIQPKGEYDYRLFPHAPAYPWNNDNFGPLVMPKEGTTVKLDSLTLPLYERLITAYEENKLEKKGGKIFLNGKEAHSYTFRQNYYFMMGDNRHNSLDSRYWGFVPEDHIVGKPVFIWLSLKKGEPFLKAFRWERVFSFVHSDKISKSYLLYALLIGGGIWAWFQFRGKKNEGQNVPVKDILNKGKKGK